MTTDWAQIPRASSPVRETFPSKSKRLLKTLHKNEWITSLMCLQGSIGFDECGGADLLIQRFFDYVLCRLAVGKARSRRDTWWSWGKRMDIGSSFSHDTCLGE